MINDEKEQIIINRIKNTIELFFENNCSISDKDLAEVLTLNGIKTSSSTVGRDLTSEKAEALVGTEIIEKIKEYRQKNKELGLSKGGQHSVFNNNIERDENGKFTGSKPRK